MSILSFKLSLLYKNYYIDNIKMSSDWHVRSQLSFQSQFEDILYSSQDQKSQLTLIQSLIAANTAIIEQIFVSFIVQTDQINDYLAIFEQMLAYFTHTMLGDLQLLRLTAEQKKIDAICLHSLAMLHQDLQ